MAVPKRKMSRSNTRHRRSAWKAVAPSLVTCSNPACGKSAPAAPRLPRVRAVRRQGRPSSGPLTPTAGVPAVTGATGDTDELREALGDPTLDPELLELALTHRSFAYENGNLPTNERLEFLGDSVLGVVVTETLYLTHPSLSEGRLAKLRAAVVNARALADVARTIGLGVHVRLGKGEESTGGRAEGLDPLRHRRGADRGGLPLRRVRGRRRGDPPALRPAARGRGRDGRRPGLEDQPPGAQRRHELGVPEYVIQDEGPDHMKTFTARVRVAAGCTGTASAGPRRRPSSRPPSRPTARSAPSWRRPPSPRPAAAEATAGADADRRRTPGPRPRAMPELPEVEVVRRGLEAHVLGRPVRSRRGAPSPPRTTPRRRSRDFAARLTGRTFTAARRRGKYLWLPLDNGDALLGHLGMSGQMLVQPPGAPDERHLRVRFDLGDRASSGSSTSGCSAGWRSRTGGAVVPPEIAHIARDPLDPHFDDAEFVRRVRRSDVRDQAAAAQPDRRLRCRQHLRRRGRCGWPGCTGSVPGSRLRAADVDGVLAGCREVMLAALGQGGTSFDALYVNVNGQSGYFDRCLEAYGREGQPCSRCGTPIRRVVFMNRSSYFCPGCQPPPRRGGPGAALKCSLALNGDVRLL